MSGRRWLVAGRPLLLSLLLASAALPAVAGEATDAVDVRHVVGPHAPGLVAWKPPPEGEIQVAWVEVPFVGTWRVAVDPARLSYAWAHGRVIDERERPIAGADVYLLTEPRSRSRDGRGRPRGHRVESDADGAFRFVFAPEEPASLEVWADGYWRQRLFGLRRDLDTHGLLEVVMHPSRNLLGRTISTAGEPVEDARVSVVPPDEPGGPPVVSPFVARTDERGAFVLEGLDPARGDLRLLTLSTDHVPTEVDVPELAPDDVFEIVLEPAVRLEVRVVDPQGKPVSGAFAAVERGELTDSLPLRFLDDGTTGDDGRTVLRGLEEGPRRLVVMHVDYELVAREVDVRADAEALEVELTPEARHRLEGRVTAERGPVDGLRVSLRQASGGVWVPSTPLTATTSGGGVFSFDEVPIGRFTVDVSGDISDDASSSRTVGVLAPEDRRLVVSGPMQIELRLVAPAVVSGRLVGLEPAELAEVYVSASAGPGVGTLRGEVDPATSTYRIEGVPAGRVTVRAFVPEAKRVSEPARIPPGVGEVLVDLDFRSEEDEGHRLSGRVLRDGVPLSDAVLRVDGAVRKNAYTDGYGEFAIDGLPPGDYHLFVYGEGTAWTRTSAPPIHGEVLELRADREVEIVVRPGAEVRGTVTDASGMPLADVVVALSGASFHVGSSQMTTDGAGRFELASVPPGRWELSLRRAGYAPASRELEVESADLEVEVEMEETPGLDVRVRRPDGGQPPMWSLALLDAAGEAVAFTASDRRADGGMRMANAPRGTWDLVARSPDGGFAALAQGVQVPGPEVELVAGPTARVELEVPELFDVPRAEVHLVHEVVGPFRHQVPRELKYGHATLDGLPAGRWTVQVGAPDGRTWRKPFLAHPGATDRLTLP